MLQRITLLPSPRQMRVSDGFSNGPVRAVIDPGVARPQGYRLLISPTGIELIGHDSAGLFYGQQTLSQLRRLFGSQLPNLQIEDWPDFPVRGVMLDISRDKVPTMATLLQLVEMLAEWKINQLQLYTEHTFAYLGYEEVWKDASPLTPNEMKQLDEYCRERFIELVPNQNSFGHMERWLRHPRYLPLAESPEGAPHPAGYFWKGPFSLCPTDPKCVDFLADLYGQLLPNFSSRLFNVGCDETFDIGYGRSKSECDRRGVANVYLDFLEKVHKLVESHGRRMMFWGDIVLHHPESAARLPKDVIALNWGYEADHLFDAETSIFAKAGIPFYVCPGTSSWCSIAGRTDNMLANQRNAAEAGLRNGAIGYLNTDWGDFGHLQYLPITFAGLAAGAMMTWCLESNRSADLPAALDTHAFHDRAGVMGKLARDLGNVYLSAGKLMKNRSALFNLLVPSSTHLDPMQGITREAMEATESAIASAIAPLDSAKMDRPDADLIRDEFRNAAAMLRAACRRGLGENPSMDEIIHEHRRLWLARNRPGGLEDSILRLTSGKDAPLW
ncbi:MAG: family 20 glycosylhydrolase [Tepidisphaeraceae bacterium]|jgi:hypothetical protein